MAEERARALTQGGDTRYMFGLLDHRSRWGTGLLPEAFVAPEMDIDQELRLDYEHRERHGRQENEVQAELEWNVQRLNFTLEVPYDIETEREQEQAGGAGGQAAPGQVDNAARPPRRSSRGVATITVSARYPIYQYVSPHEFFDYTLLTNLELGIPTGSVGNKDFLATPSLLHTLFFGDHVTVQIRTGVQFLDGTEKQFGRSNFLYNVVLGYNLPRNELPIPRVVSVIPVFELSGQSTISGRAINGNQLFGLAGVRLNLESLGAAQPKLGAAYVFPVNQGARNEARWGIITSLVFEF